MGGCCASAAGDSPVDAPVTRSARKEQTNLTQADKDLLVTSLRKTPLLAKLSTEDLGVLAEELEKKFFEAEEYVFHEGDGGDGFYVIMDGSCVVLKQDSKNESKVNKLATLSVGDFFGEGALINEAPRQASIQASDDLTCAFWTTAKFKKLKNERLKAIRFVQRKAISAEMVSTLEDVDEKKMLKNDIERKLIYETVKQNDLFRNLSSDHMKKVIDKMYKRAVSNGETIIAEGDRGYHVYVIQKGSFDIIKKNKEGKEVKVAEWGKGQLVGELALLFNAPRAATVKAKTDAVCWAIDRFTFRNILKDVSQAATKTNAEFLKKVKLLQALTQAERNKIAEALEEKVFAKGSTIIKQGDHGDCMYIVKSGAMNAYVDGNEESVHSYGPGDFFGEKALMDDQSKGIRAATIICDTEAILLQLDRNAVFGLLGPIHDELKERSANYSSQKASDVALVTTNAKDWKCTEWKLDDLKKGKVLGKGSFGIVCIVTDPAGAAYALKSVAKKQVVIDGQQPHIVSEKRVMQRLNHPFLVKLFGTYRDESCVYFLLELCQGGELFTILRAQTRFKLSTAKFYAASVVLMFEYLHKRNIIYRDLKPENLLIDTKGFLKMTDFGFAKEIHANTYTLCGTPDYLAPEILTGKGHGKGVDWWCLGILFYEMIASFPPFYDDDPQRTYAKIMYKKVAFPSGTFTPEAKQLIRSLLEKKSHSRLGVVKGGAKLIKNHKAFDGFSFEDLVSMKMRPPIIPKIKSSTDVSAFEDYDIGEGGVPKFLPPEKYDDTWEKEFE